MRRRRRQKVGVQGVGLLTLIGLGALLSGDKAGTAGIVFVLALIASIAIYWFMQKEKRIRALKLADVDRMEGAEFESYVRNLLLHQGFRVSLTGRSGDLGVDLIAQRDGYKYAVQVKRYTHPVSRRAVSDAVAGKDHYGCSAAMVVTNSSVTEGAIKLARSTRCQLVDRDTLAEWILAFQASGQRSRAENTLS